MLLCVAAAALGQAGEAQSGTPATQAAQPVARISGGVMAGNILSKVPPQYPLEAKQQRISGVVVLHALIGKDGRVAELQAVSGPEVLSAAAMEAVRQWVYKPYLLNGQPTEVETTINVHFNLAPAPATTPAAAGETPLSSTPLTVKEANGETETIKVVKQTTATESPAAAAPADSPK